MIRVTLPALALCFLAAAGNAQTADPIAPDPSSDVPKTAQAEAPMTLERLVGLAQAVDPEAIVQGRRVQLTVSDLPVLLVMDSDADRMRAMVPVRSSETMTPDDLMRVLQANFDTALDARYAVANGRLWATFIHPLSALERDQFLSGLGQTVNLALTYGTAFSGGALSYGSGDSGEIHRQLIEDLLDKGQDI